MTAKTDASDRCTVHETPQPSLCFTCNQNNRDEWGSTEQPANRKEDK